MSDIAKNDSHETEDKQKKISTSTSNNNSQPLQKNKKSQKGLFWLLSIGNNSALTIIENFFPFFIAKIGVSNFMLGFLSSIRNLIGSFFQERIGFWSDKRGRKFLLLIGFFLSFAITTLLIFSTNPTMLIIVAIIHAFSLSIIVPVWNATLGDITKIKGRTTLIGKLSSVGQVFGVLLILFFSGLFYFLEKYNGVVIFKTIAIQNLSWEAQYGIVFGVAAFNLLICFIGTLFLKETMKITQEKTIVKLSAALKNHNFRNFIIVNSFFGFSMAIFWPIYPVIQITVVGMNFYQIALMAAIYSIFFSIFGYISGKVGDRIGRKPVLIVSRIIMFSVSLLYLPAIFTQNWIYVILTNLVSGIGNGAFLVMMNAYSLDLSSDKTMGSFSGITQASWGISTFIGSLIAGYIGDVLELHYGVKNMVLIMIIAVAIIRVFASIGYFFLKESLAKENRVIEKTTLVLEDT